MDKDNQTYSPEENKYQSETEEHKHHDWEKHEEHKEH